MLQPTFTDCPSCKGLGYTVSQSAFTGAGRATFIDAGNQPELLITAEGVARTCWGCCGKGLVPVYAAVAA